MNTKSWRYLQSFSTFLYCYYVLLPAALVAKLCNQVTPNLVATTKSVQMREIFASGVCAVVFIYIVGE